VDARLKEHQRHIRLEHPDVSAVAEHSVDLGHHIQFHNASVLATTTQYMDRIVREAIEIELHHNNMDREVSFASGIHGSHSSAPSRNLTPDIQDHMGPCMLGILVLRLLGQCPLSRPSLSPPPRPTCSYAGPGLLPAHLSLRCFPSPLTIDFPCGPLSLPS
jgi:hypothetical protein